MSSINHKDYASTPSRKVAFLGLGVMGYPMAGHLARAGHQVTVYNRTASKSSAWCTEFAGATAPKHAATPRLAAQGAELVFCCVGNDDDLRGVTLGADGAFAGMQAGTTFVDHTTASASVARELYGAAKTLGLHFIDADATGGHGARVRHAHPSYIDDLAADFPNLKIIMAHPGWPWVEETTAVALHKGNVYWEMSGWAPKHFPGNLKVDIRGRLQDKIMFGSDYPSLPYERILREWNELGYKPEVMEKIMHGNAERVLGL